MSKRFLTFGILVIVLAGIFVPSVKPAYAVGGCPGDQVSKPSFEGGKFVYKCIDPTTGEKTLDNTNGSTADAGDWPLANAIKFSIAKWVSQSLMFLSSLVLVLCGKLFDFILDFTIVRMAENLGSSGGIGAGITSAWATLRDIANMVFIFVLLYAAFKAMFDTNFSGFGKTVRDIIIVALLINFSLFFSKVVIDASNIVAIGFYNSITSSTSLGPLETGGETTSFKGIGAGYMNMLGVQTLYSSKLLDNPILVKDPGKMWVVGIMSSVFMLITAVILLISGIMFAARFIILIFIMILSSLALIAYIIPGQKKYFDQWKDALIAQSFFAPVYFALTWVVFKIGSSLLPVLKDAGAAAGMPQSGVMTDMFTKPGSTVAILINYVLIIGFSIAALVISKSMASKTPGFKQVSGGIGAAALGGAGFLGRNTIGWKANKIAGDKDLQERAARGDIGARMKLATAQKLAGSSFDVRAIPNTKVGKALGAGTIIDTSITGKAGGEGGFKKTKEFWTMAESRKKRTEDVMKRYRNNPTVLGDHLESLSYGDQKAMYDKLSARDRAAVDEALDKKHGTTGGANATTTKLRADLSPEEREKTEKAAREAEGAAKEKEYMNAIEDLTHGRPAFIPGTTTPATFDDLLVGRNKLKVTNSRKLSIDTLNEEEVIKRLSPRHLKDIIENKDDLDDRTIDYIVSVVDMAPPYPLQTSQHKYIYSSDATKAMWRIP